MIACKPELDLMTLSAIARLLNTTPQAIEAACERAGIPAAQRLSGMFMFSLKQLPAIRKALRPAGTTSRL